MPVINGTPDDDVLLGTAGADAINGLAGNDTLTGNEGVDQLFGGDDNDVLTAGGPFDDILAGEVYNGGSGYDALRLGTGVARPDGHRNINYFQATVSSIEEVEFGDTGPGFTFALFLTFQLGGGLSNNLNVVGSANNDDLVFLAVTPGVHSLAGTNFTFENWTESDEYWLGDHIQLFGALALNYTLIGSDRSDVIQGNVLADVLHGGDGDDFLTGRAGADALYGGEGNDQFLIGSNDPTYVEDYSLETFDGGNGTDLLWIIGEHFDLRSSGIVVANMEGIQIAGTLTFFTSPEPHSVAPLLGGEIIVDLAFLAQLPSALIVSGSGHYTTSAGQLLTQADVFTVVLQPGDNLDMSTWTFTHWETQDEVHVVGSGVNDTVTGSSVTDAMEGGGGADLLIGLGGDDVLMGGDGADILRGDGLNNYLGPAGSNALDGGGGDDVLRGGAGVDTYVGGDGIDRISFYMLAATQGAYVDLNTGIVSNDGFGNVETFTGIENLGGGTAFVDTFIGNDNANLLIGELGDTLLGNGGDDSFQVHGALLLLDGGAGVDTIIGFAGNTLGMAVPDGNNDGLNDEVFATSGVHVNLASNRIVDDGFGNSGVVVNVENVSGSTLDDRLIGDGGANVLRGNLGADRLDGGSGNDTLHGDDGNDELNGELGDDSMFGGEGSDDMNGGGGLDHLEGGGGDDVLRGEAHDDVLIGGAGDDDLRGGGGDDQLDGGADDDNLEGEANDDVLNGGAGFDHLNGGGGDDVMHGGDDDDVLLGDTGADAMFGDGGADTLNGGGGVDRIEGGAGADILTGGTSNDVFVYAPGAGADTILDFDANPSSGQDLIDLSGYGVTAGDFGVRVSIVDTGADIFITIDGIDTILLVGVSGTGANAVTVTDFFFGP